MRLKEKFGTPRAIGSDGKHLIIGDHNAYGSKQGNFFWKNFPIQNDQEPDFFMANFEQAPPPPKNKPLSFGINTVLAQVPPFDQNTGNLPPLPSNQNPDNLPQFQGPVGQPSDIFWGPVFTRDGKLIVLSGSSIIGIWNSFPENEKDKPDLIIGQSGGPGYKSNGYVFAGGDGSSMALAGDKLYIALCNSNKIVGFNSIPNNPDQLPDFVIGAPNINTNTLETSFIMSNPVPVSDGKHLFVSSDFDRKIYVYKNLPNESGAKPDLVYNLPEGPCLG